MAGSATAKAEAAAEAVEAFLRARRRVDQPATAAGTTLGAVPHPPVPHPPVPHPLLPHPLLPQLSEPTTLGSPPRGSGVAAGRDAAAIPPAASTIDGEGPMRLPNTDWLHQRLTVTGPDRAMAAFREAAGGAGTIPWQLDLASLEEDWFHHLVDPAHRSLSLPGARILAAQLREAVERRHALAVARVGRSRACPFDLHALAPVPPVILASGPDHPDALAWLWQHWGTTEALRHVTVDSAADRRGDPPAGPGWRLQFWSADWTPWRAVARIRTDWPTLRFDVAPSYA